MLRSVLRAAQQANVLLQQPVHIKRSPVFLEQIRTGVILERLYPPFLTKEDQDVRLRPKNFVYKVVGNTDQYRHTPLEVVLVQNVEGIGLAGDIVKVRRHLARSDLLPSGKAVYASPENIAEYAVLKTDDGTVRQTTTGMQTLKQLEKFHLKVPMSPHNPWTLNKTHVKAAFRKMGVILKEDTLELPEEEITSPQKIDVKVTVNGLETATVQTTVYHFYHDPSQIPADQL